MNDNKDPWEYSSKDLGNSGEQGTDSSAQQGTDQPGTPQQDGYQNPGQNGAPYQDPQGNPPSGQYSGYQNPGGYGNRYTNPYSQPNGQPYWGGDNQPPQPPHNKMSGGLKAFLWVLGVIAAGLIGTFAFFSINPEKLRSSPVASSQASSSPSSSNGYGETIPKTPSSSSSSANVISGVTGDGTDPKAAGISLENKPSGSSLTAPQVYKKVIGSVVSVETAVSSGGKVVEESEGTGIVATANGYILTNAHVVNDSRSSSVKVVLQNQKEYEAKVVGLDKTSDLAVLRINASSLSPATFGKAEQLEIGEQVLAIGNPAGLSFAGSLTSGIVSALNRSIESHSDNGMTYIQTDAAINPGNSGGPLVDMYGQVVGINSNKIVATGYEGMGFSIPISKAQSIINQLIRNGYVSGRTRLGISVQNVSGGDLLGNTSYGVIIRSIDSDSDVGRAGAKVGDIIIEADGNKITTRDDLSSALSSHKPGDTISLKIYTSSNAGGATTKTIQVKLLEDKGETQK